MGWGLSCDHGAVVVGGGGVVANMGRRGIHGAIREGRHGRPSWSGAVLTINQVTR